MDNLFKTLGELKSSKYKSKTIKDELRDNLIHNISNNINVFETVHGFDSTVIPQLESAILSGHNINFLGLRGQAKTRLARLMVNLLDEYIPIIEGSELNDDPFNPITAYAKNLITKHGDDTPIAWLHRSDRFSEKLATPDVTIADLIGDVDPIKAATLKLTYADDRVIHYGMVPRSNRCIFVINEIPDLQARIQVALFNILQEGDVQIRGFKLRLDLDLQFIFTANPEDYTNRGSIVTPLKDRIGSQIITHYPNDIEIAKLITAQEVALKGSQKIGIQVPELAKSLIEQINFEARNSPYVDEKSGVSARLSISAFQNLVSTAELRLIKSNDKDTVVRMSDFFGVVPAITGKIELVYEGEQEGAESVAKQLVTNAVKTLFPNYFPNIEKLEKEEDESPYDGIINWFFENEGFEILDHISNEDYNTLLNSVRPLNDLIENYQPKLPDFEINFMKEFLLWGLVQSNKLTQKRFNKGIQIQDPFGSFIRKL